MNINEHSIQITAHLLQYISHRYGGPSLMKPVGVVNVGLKNNLERPLERPGWGG